ncbi:MAG TPA: NAD(P)H-dependent oxidoreductase [Chitinophagales bacterium]|nr:NAD(P)H-dependent oxidoreductase [Chitinophagales bacterium]
MKITVISGSPRQQSFTVHIAKYLHKHLAEKYPAHEFEFLNLQEAQLPYVEKVWSTINDVPEQFKDAANKVYTADAFVLVTPEYNGSMTSALRNLFDHFPKQVKKTFGIVTASEGAMGGIRAAVGMQNQICGWFGIVCPNMLLIPAMDKKFDKEGNLLDEKFMNNIMTFTNEFTWLAEAVYSKKHS